MSGNNDEVLWLLPDTFGATTTTTDLDNVVVTNHPTMFPQTRTDNIPCERWGQQDVYSADSAYLGDTLEWVDGQPEDHAIYVSHTWVYGGSCEVVEEECPEGYVPGWLDEDGNAQGCVNNGPIPTPEPEPEPTPTVPVPSDTPTDVPTLAETGVDPLVGLIVAACLIGAGLWLKR